MAQMDVEIPAVQFHNQVTHGVGKGVGDQLGVEADPQLPQANVDGLASDQARVN